MRHEKTIIDSEGNKLKLCITFYEHSSSTFENYSATLYKCLKGKRTFHTVVDTDSYTYRGLSMEKRKEFEKQAIIDVIGKDEYNQAVKECWLLLEPKYV